MGTIKVVVGEVKICWCLSLLLDSSWSVWWCWWLGCGCWW